MRPVGRRPRFSTRLAGAASEPFFGVSVDHEGHTIRFYEAGWPRCRTLAVADVRTNDVQAIYRIAWHRLAYIQVGNGGGKRHRSSEPVRRGLRVLEEMPNEGHYRNMTRYLCLIESDDDWSCEYDQYKDDVLVEHVVLREGG